METRKVGGETWRPGRLAVGARQAQERLAMQTRRRGEETRKASSNDRKPRHKQLCGDGGRVSGGSNERDGAPEGTGRPAKKDKGVGSAD